MAEEVLEFPFPGNPRREKPPAPPSLKKPPVFETFGEEESLGLLQAAEKTLAGARTLIEFIRADRSLARQAGIETFGIEILAVMEGDRFSRTVDALEDAAKNGRPAHLSEEGIRVLSTLETLVAEASSNIRRFADGDLGSIGLAEARARLEAESQKAYVRAEEAKLEGARQDLRIRERQARAISELRSSLSLGRPVPSGSLGAAREIPLGAAAQDSSSAWIPLLIFGGVAVAAVVAAALLHNSRVQTAPPKG
jgi:hypothetical protein